MSHSPSFEEVLKDCRTEDKYVETCRRIGDREYDPTALKDLWEELRTDPKRYLTNEDLDRIFSQGKTHYGYYWKVPGVNLDGVEICLKKSKEGGDIKQWRRGVVKDLFAQLKSMEVTSVVLANVHPNDFGIYSPPILIFLQVPPRPPVRYFLEYCEELRAWGRRFLQTESVLATDHALWVFYQAAYGHKPIKDKVTSYRESFEKDEWVRERHAQNLLSSYFSEYKPLDQARLLLDIDPYLSGKIAGCEFEARVKELVDFTEAGRVRKIVEFINGLRNSNPESAKWGSLQAMVEYVVAKQRCHLPLGELHRIRSLRNDAIHMSPGLNKEKVEDMIRIAGKLPSGQSRGNRSQT